MGYFTSFDRHRFCASAVFGLAAWCGAAMATDPVKVPLESNDSGSIYVQPNVASTEDSVNTKGAVMGVQRKDGSGAYAGVDTGTPKPTYSLGASTGGNTSFSAGVQSDGKENNGVKAGVTIKY
ncbi:MAG: hypothetical protein V4636_23510 [Pseudomonadota bacterium]